MLESHVEKLLAQRYYHEGEDWPKLVDRIVDYVCSDESEEFQRQVRYLLLERIFLPNSPCLVNAGKKDAGLFACFVVGPTEDTLENHLETLADIATVAKRGGGCGFTGTNIRYEGAPVAGSAHGYAYGPNNWAMSVDAYMQMMSQAGFRNMALMYTLSSDHPDLEKFINLKQTAETTNTGFNQSIMASDDWMSALKKKGEEWRLFWKLAENAWNNGEPGLLFADTINNNTPYQLCGCKIEATNPCGEQPLPPYGSCNLGSINLAHEVFYYGAENKGFDFERLEQTVKVVTRFLDNIGSKNVFPNKKFQDWYNDHRPIGIGIMGYADALLRLKFRYGDSDSQVFLRNVMTFIRDVSYEESENLAFLRGVPKHCIGVGRRNMTTVSIAPTGSIAFLAGCSHGIEPIFSPKYTRTDERGEIYYFVHELANEPYFVSAINPIPDKVPSWKEHIDIQVAAQTFCDSGVSKTINMDEDVKIEDVALAFMYAWEHGAKGITVYRNNSRQFQILNDSKSAQNQSLRDAPKRPDRLPCKLHVTSVKGQKYVVLVGFLDDEPFEVFVFQNGAIRHKEGVLIKRGKGIYDLEVGDKILIKDIAGSKSTDEEQALTRLISLSLRHGVKIDFIIEQLNKSGGTVTSFSKAVNRILRKYLPKDAKLKCPDCGSKELMMIEGCMTCQSCLSSKCS